MNPQDFIVFCWLPFAIPAVVAEDAYALMQRVQQLDPRFSLKLRVPAEPGGLFPALFAYVSDNPRKDARKEASSSKSVLSESDVYAFTGSIENEDEDECLWDITWAR